MFFPYLRAPVFHHQARPTFRFHANNANPVIRSVADAGSGTWEKVISTCPILAVVDAGSNGNGFSFTLISTWTCAEERSTGPGAASSMNGE